MKLGIWCGGVKEAAYTCLVVGEGFGAPCKYRELASLPKQILKLDPNCDVALFSNKPVSSWQTLWNAEAPHMGDRRA